MDFLFEKIILLVIAILLFSIETMNLIYVKSFLLTILWIIHFNSVLASCVIYTPPISNWENAKLIFAWELIEKKEKDSSLVFDTIVNWKWSNSKTHEVFSSNTDYWEKFRIWSHYIIYADEELQTTYCLWNKKIHTSLEIELIEEQVFDFSKTNYAYIELSQEDSAIWSGPLLFRQRITRVIKII